MTPSIITGFEADCKKLLVRFEKESTVRFETFVEIWKDMKFTLIFSGRSSREIIYFTNEILLYLKSFFFLTNSFLRKVCCLYLIYGVYYKQPIKNISKINLTIDEWRKMKEFIMILKENHHLDALYIILKLVFDNAFRFTLLQEKILTPVRQKLIHYDKEIVEEEVNFNNLNIETLLEELNGVETAYEEAKKDLVKSIQIPDINYSNNNITEKLRQIMQPKVNTNKNVYEPQPGTSTEQNVGNLTISEKRQKLKRKSFQHKADLYLQKTVTKK